MNTSKIESEESSFNVKFENYYLINQSKLPSQINNIITTLSIHNDDKKCIYGFLYSNINETNLEKRNKNILEHNLLCNSPTFISCDGEYRKNIIYYDQLLEFQKNNDEYFDEFENVIINLMNKSKINLSFDVFIPDKYNNYKNKICNEIDASRILINSLIINIILNYNDYKKNTIENHVSKNYIDLIFNNNCYDKIFDKLNNKFLVDVELYFKKLNKKNNMNYECIFTLPIIGQKYIQLSKQELIHALEVEYTPWKEIYINSRIYDLVLNKITFCFPFASSWILVQNADIKLYDNIQTYDKFSKSLSTSALNDQLIKMYKEIIEEECNNKDKYEKYAKLLDGAILYAEKNIELSNCALSIFSEYIGRTFADYPRMIYNLKNPPNLINLFNSDYFHKIIFEYIFSIYAMNTKCKIIHSDLHQNNFTMNIIKYMWNPPTKNDPQPQPTNKNIFTKIYKVDKFGDYVFVDYGLHAGIIDFSRAIINDFDDIQKRYGDSTYNIEVYRNKKALIKSISKLFYDYYIQHKSTIKLLVQQNYSCMFNLFTLIDTYMITNSILSVLETEKDNFYKFYNNIYKNKTKIYPCHLNINKDELEYNKLSMEILENIKKLSYDEMFDNLKLFVDERERSGDSDELRAILSKYNDYYPVSQFFKLFTDYKYDKQEKILTKIILDEDHPDKYKRVIITDMMDINNEFVYNCLDKILPHDIEIMIANYGILEPDSEQQVMNFVKEQTKQSRRINIKGGNNIEPNELYYWQT